MHGKALQVQQAKSWSVLQRQSMQEGEEQHLVLTLQEVPLCETRLILLGGLAHKGGILALDER